MTCSIYDDLYVKRCKFHKNVESEKSTIISILWSLQLLELIQWLLLKMEQMKPYQNILYYILPGSSFLCKFRIWSQNSNILSVASDMANLLCINGATLWRPQGSKINLHYSQNLVGCYPGIGWLPVNWSDCQ